MSVVHNIVPWQYKVLACEYVFTVVLLTQQLLDIFKSLHLLFFFGHHAERTRPIRR